MPGVVRILGMETPITGSYWVEPGRLLAGAYARDPAALVAAGVTLFVDLTEEGELLPYLVDATARHERVPVPDFSAPPVPTMRRVLDLIRAELEAGGLVYLHCHGGCGRTGTVVGCWLVERGLPGEEALARVAELSGWRCPETPEQRALVVGWTPLGSG